MSSLTSVSYYFVLKGSDHGSASTTSRLRKKTISPMSPISSRNVDRLTHSSLVYKPEQVELRIPPPKELVYQDTLTPENLIEARE